MSRRGKRRLILVTLLIFVLGGGLVVFKLARSFQQARLVADARAEGLAAFEAGQDQKAIEALSYYIQHEREDVQAYMAFAAARQNVPMANNQHIVDALGLYKQSLKLLDADAAAPERTERQREVLDHLVELYGIVGLRFEQIQTANRILEIEPDNVKALSARAAANFIDRNFTEALKDTQRLIEIEPDVLTWRGLHIETMRRQSVPDAELLVLCQEWMDQYDGDGRYYVIKAGLLASMGRVPEAREMIRQAADRGASSLDVLEQMIGILDELQMRDVARETIEEAKSRLPDEQWVRQAIVHREWQSGHFEDALVELQAAERDFGQLEPGMLRLKALVLAGSQRPEEALAVLRQLEQQAVSQTPRDEATISWARAMIAFESVNDQTWPEVMKLIDHAVSLQPSDPTLHLLRGQGYLNVSEFSQAAEAIERAVQLDPNWVAAGLAYAQVLQQTGRTDEAFVAAQNVLKRSDRSYLPPYLVYARAYLGVLDSGGDPRFNSALLGHGDEVVRVFEDIHRQLPDQREVATLLAETYARTGRPDRASQFIRSIMGRENPPTELLLALVGVSARHDLGLEQSLIERATAADSNDLAVVFARAGLLGSKGQQRQGLALIDEAFASAGPQVANSLEAQQGRLRYLSRINAPELQAEIRRFMEANAASSAAQSFVLALSPAWEDQTLIEEAIVNLKASLGDRSQRAQLAEAQYLLRFRAGEEAKLAEAVSLLNSILQRSPNSLAALTFMAEASLQGEHPSPTRAVENLERAVSIAPGQVELYPRLIRLQQELGDFDAARRHLERYGELVGLDERHQRVELELLQRQGDFESALVRASEMFDASSPENDQLVLASMHRRAGNFDAAEAVYRRLLERPDHSTMVVSEAAEFFAESGRFERGRQLLFDLDPAVVPERALLLGRFHDRHGKPEDAEQWMKAAVEQAPDSAEIRNEISRFYLGQDKYDLAREHAMIGLKMAPEDARLRGTLALANLNLEGTGRREAIQILREFSGEDDDLLALLELLDEVPTKDGKPVVDDSILRKARRLVEDHGGLVATWHVASQLFAQGGKVEEAVELSRRAVSRFPAQPEPARWATELLGRAGRWDEALVEAQEWRRRTLQDPLPADVMIARILLEVDRPKDAVDQLQPHAQRISVQQFRHPDRMSTWLQALMGAGRRDLASSLAMPLLDADAEWRSQWLVISDSLPDEAAYEALQMLSSVPVSDPQEKLQIGVAWYKLGLRTDRAEHFARADQFAADAMESPAVRENTLILRGAIAEGRGDLSAAESWYRKVLETTPQQDIALNNLAFALHRQGRSDEALPLIERTLRRRPNDPNVLDTYGNVLLGIGRLKDAAAALNQALAQRPADPAINLSLARVLLEQGQYDLAVERLETAKRSLGSIRRPSRSKLREAQELEQRLQQLSAAVTPG